LSERGKLYACRKRHGAIMNRDREKGLGAVAYTCSYVPAEIIMAAGFLPRRIVPERRPSEADAYMHPNSCHYLKSLLASALAGDIPRMDGIVFANSCDGMRRLHDLWKEYANAAPALFMDVPKKKDAVSIEFFASELRAIAEKLEKEFYGAKVTSERLNEAIALCNQIRFRMNEVFTLQRDESSGVSGLAVFELCLEGTNSPVKEFTEKVGKFISDSRDRGSVSGGRQKVVLTGNVLYRPDLITLIEDSGGRVVAMDTCIGIKQYDTPVEEDSPDPMLALAERYLLKPPCARMLGVEERFQYLKRLAEDSAAAGIVYTTVKFCDTYLYDVPSMRSRFEREGIPFLLIENDYEWSGLEQMKTRVEAFIAMLDERGANRDVQDDA